MISVLTFNDLNVNMWKVFEKDGIWTTSSSGWIIFEHLTLTGAWLLIKLHKLTEIVCQNSDPEFAELLNRVCVGEQTQSDIAAIHVMTDTDISHWSKSFHIIYDKSFGW